MDAAARGLPVAPRPREDELISSWLGRTAARYDLDAASFRAILFGDGRHGRDRPDIDLAASEAARMAQAFRLPLERVAALDLRRAWPGLATDWLPTTGRGKRVRGDLDLSWCRQCLEDGHRSDDTYLDRELALPLVLCHRHLTWRFDCCRFCRPMSPARFIYCDGTVELACGDCNRLLRMPGRRTWAADWETSNRHLGRMFEILLLFEKCLRSAWLGCSVRLHSIGQVAPAEFLAFVGDLTQALLAPNLSSTSLINRYDCDLLSIAPHHKPDHWRKQPYHELGPMWRAWVLSAVIAIVSSEETSLLFSDRYWSRFAAQGVEPRSLEWLFENAAKWVKAMPVRGSTRWLAPLRERMRLLYEQSGIDVDAVLAQFEARRTERDKSTEWAWM